jgi:hypothetical protein
VSGETKWTKGPWKTAFGACYGTKGETLTEWFVRRPSDDVAICAEVRNPDTAEPSEANAALIAAAPDLYAALARLLATSALMEPREYTEAASAARAALARARGEVTP